MATLNFSLPKSMQEFVERQIRTSGYSNISEYLRALIREDQKRANVREVEQLILDGIHCEERIEVDSSYWRGKKDDLQRKFGKKPPKRRQPDSR